MRWVAGIFGLILVAGVITVISLTQRMDFSSKKMPKPFRVHATEPAPR
jgi:hypothetical protein